MIPASRCRSPTVPRPAARAWRKPPISDYRAPTNGGPTVRTCVLPPLAGAGAGVAFGSGVLAAGLAPFGCGACDKVFAVLSLTTISPLSSVDESSASLSASAQLWPGRRQEHV